jgi:hypothetical protein
MDLVFKNYTPLNRKEWQSLVRITIIENIGVVAEVVDGHPVDHS